MDGRRLLRTDIDKPIAKPDFPLPSLFNRRAKSELPTRRGRKRSGPSEIERAHFYRKTTTDSGTPVYDFFITTETVENTTNQ